MSAEFIPDLTSSGRRSGRFSSSLNHIEISPAKRGYIAGFRDTVIKQVELDDVSVAEPDEAPGSNVDPVSPVPKRLEKNKLIIILVGLPGRGKTYLCNKLMCYLNWLGHKSRHFNVGVYRRSTRASADELQDANFFDHNNQEGMAARQLALDLALADLANWLSSAEDNQVAIFDATNSTEERRRYLRSKFHGKFQYMYIESICNDQETLEKNYRLKMKYSPDYQGMDTEKALADFKDRIARYEKVYQPMTDGTSNRDMHFIQLVDMVTGRGHMDINRISGYIPGKIVFFLMQVCKAGLTATRKIWLSRHGESQFNALGKIGGDAPLTEKGEDYASRLPDVLIPRLPLPESPEGLVPVSVWTSTLTRTIQTAANLPFPKLRWKALDEIAAGICDGMTYEEIKEQMPQVHEDRKKDKLSYRYPSGESYLDVIQRLEPVVIETERQKESVVIIGHQAILRVLYGYLMKVDIKEIPELSIPLHTLIELEPRPDGTMVEKRFKVNIQSKTVDELFTDQAQISSTTSPGSAPFNALQIPAAPVPSSSARPLEKVPVIMEMPEDHPFNLTQPDGAVASELARKKKPKSPVKHGVAFSADTSVDSARSTERSARTIVSMSSCASPADLRPELHLPSAPSILDELDDLKRDSIDNKGAAP